MPISVDLPAPFSPTRPWTVPARTISERSRLAWTSPNRLSMPRSSMTGAAIGMPGSLRHVVGDLDLAGHDVGARLPEAALHLRRDQAAVVLVQRVSDAALGDTEIAHAGLPRPVLRGLEGLEDGEVDALDHRGQNRAGLNVVLVGVDADGEPPLVLGGLEHAEPGGPGGGVDDVGAAIELAPRELAASRRVVPRGRRRPRHVLEDLDLGIDVPGALLVAHGELADQRDVHAPDEPDLARLRGHGRRHPHQERALVLLEHDRLDIGQVHDRVDDGELDAGELLGHLLHAAGLREADAHDDLRAAPRHVAQRLLALGLRGDLELAIRDARLLLEALG